MRSASLAAGVMASLLATAPLAVAQDASMSPTELAAVCVPPAHSSRGEHALRVAGSQDTVPRIVLDKRDLLIITGGTDAGIQLGARFFVRRVASRSPMYELQPGNDIATDGWIEIIAVNDSTSIARVLGMCGAIYLDDYLEPFAVPPTIAASDAPLDPDFSDLGRIVTGADGHTLTGINEILVIDRGSEQGMQPGARFAVYRDLTANVDPLLAAPAGTPLTAIGEGVVLSATGNRAIARIVRARDAVRTGDYVAPAKK